MIKGLALLGLLAGTATASEAEFVRALAAGGAGFARQIETTATGLGSVGEAGRVIADKTTQVSVDLNPATVKCSRADYGQPMLKILVPALAELTLLNHRNTREGAPCVSAGRCGAELGPQNILASGAGTVQASVRVVLRKVTALEEGVCRVSLVESVHTSIRGLAFVHERTQEVAERDPADCR